MKCSIIPDMMKKEDSDFQIETEATVSWTDTGPKNYAHQWKIKSYKDACNKKVGRVLNLPGKRCMKTLTILSKELKTKLHLHTISAQARGPCSWVYQSQYLYQIKHKIKVIKPR